MAPLSKAQIQEYLGKLSGWDEIDMGGRPGICKSFDTKGFMRGLAFVTQVAVLAEKAEHHPDVTLTYPKVTLQLTTHDAGGLTEKDFALAAEIDNLEA